MIDAIFYYSGMMVFAWFALGIAIAVAGLSWEYAHHVINRLEWKTPRTTQRTTA